MMQEQGLDSLQKINPRMEQLRSGSKILDRRARHIIVFAKKFHRPAQSLPADFLWQSQILQARAHYAEVRTAAMA